MPNSLIKTLIGILFFFPERLSHRFIFLLLDHIEEGPVKTKYGYRIHFKNTNKRATEFRKHVVIGWYSYWEMNILKEFIASGDCVIDVGAYEGYFSLFMSRLVGGKGKVFSVEPNKENRYFLTRNIEYNSAANITTIGKAISNEKTRKDFYYSEGVGDGGGLINFSYFPERRTVTVDVDTLDNMFGDCEKRINFIKIDTEGNDFNVLRGAEQILSKHKPVVCFETSLTFWAHLDISIDRLFDFTKGKGYELFTLEKDKLRKIDLFGKHIFDTYAIHSSQLERFSHMLH